MYTFLSLLNGILVAVMISLNGYLAAVYGSYGSTVIIHVVGCLFALLLLLPARKKLCRSLKLAPWQYLGGAIGFLTVVLDNLAFGRISMTSLIAISLFSQTLFSVLIDIRGLFGMQKIPFRRSSLAGLLCSFAGIALMLLQNGTGTVFAVACAFGTGITVVLSRTVNASLAAKTTPLQGSLVNHLVGLPFAVLFTLLLNPAEMSSLAQLPDPRLWIYLGGVLGVLTVLMNNITVPRLPAFTVTLLSFLGQIFTGLLLDLLLGGTYSRSSLAGGLIIAAGMALNLCLEQFSAMKKEVKKESSFS